MPADKKNVLVIGAGVIGLQTALTFLQEGTGYQIYVVADYLPGDEASIYASAWAGAQWRSHEEAYNEAASWDAETYRFWAQLVQREKGCGIALMKGVNYWTSPAASISTISSSKTQIASTQPNGSTVSESSESTPEAPYPWWSSLVSEYKRIAVRDLPRGVIMGVSFQTFTIDPPVYLAYLLDKIQEFGGRVFRTRLPVEEGIEGAVMVARKVIGLDKPEQLHALVNATGLRARDLVHDDSLYPIRGQTVRVKGVAHAITTRLGAHKGDVVAVMPRPGSGLTVIGVTVEPEVWKTEAEDDKVPSLLERGKALAPELVTGSGEFEIVNVGVGLRPGRKGGARVELEVLASGLAVIHEYGHAGAGYQNSIGSARKALKLLQDHEGLRKNRRDQS